MYAIRSYYGADTHSSDGRPASRLESLISRAKGKKYEITVFAPGSQLSGGIKQRNNFV